MNSGSQIPKNVAEKINTEKYINFLPELFQNWFSSLRTSDLRHTTRVREVQSNGPFIGRYAKSLHAAHIESRPMCHIRDVERQMLCVWKSCPKLR